MVKTSRRTLLKAAVITGAVVALVSCGQTPTASPKPTAVTTTTTVPLTSLGLIPAASHVEDRVVLTKSKVRAGTSITGTLIVTNASPVPINLTLRCRPDFAVVISNPIIKQEPAFTTPCSSQPMFLHAGANRYPVSVTTTYLSCLQPGGRSVAPIRECTKEGPPPLPAGIYRTVLYGSGDLALPEPPPVEVHLT